jgi:hypothetical protein
MMNHQANWNHLEKHKVSYFEPFAQLAKLDEGLFS